MKLDSARRVFLCLLLVLGGFTPSTALGDDPPPTIAITFPQRAAFLSGPSQITVQGTAEDAGSGVKRVEVNGETAFLNGNQWSLPIQLDFGTNILTVRATDAAGNQASTSWSFLYAPSYLPAGAPVENGFALRLSDRALSGLEDEIAGLNLNPIQVGKTTATVELVPGGFQVTLDLKHVSAANPEFTAKSATVVAVLAVGVANRKFSTSMQGPPTVILTKFKSNATSEKVVEGVIASGMQTSLPPLLNATLNGLIQPRTFVQGGVQTSPDAISIDPRDVRIYVDSLVAPSLPPLPNDPPGSLSRNGATTAAPAFTTARDVSLSIREDLMNQILYAAWVSGDKLIRIDQQFLSQTGVRLPFKLDASFLLPFFPALPSAPGKPAPLAIELLPALPPVLEVTGAPGLITSSFGELGLSIQLDLGSGYVDILRLVVQAEMSTQVAVESDELVITAGDPVRIAASIESNPLGLNHADIDRFLNLGLPLIVQVAQSMIPSIPIPPLPPEIKLKNLSIRMDGEGRDFITIEGDL